MTLAPPAPPISIESPEPSWRNGLYFLLLIVALHVVIGPKVRLSQWEITAEKNSAVAEGEAWLHGRLDIPPDGPDPSRQRMNDTACFNGRVYNVFPPIMGVLTVLLSPLHHLLLDRTDRWLPWTHVLLIYWPLPVIAYVVLRRQTRDSAWAALLTFLLLAGTAVLPNLYWARFGQLGQTHHVVATVGLLILAADLLGRRCVWPGLIGLLLAGWSRQMTLLYALPLLWAAWRRGRLAACAAGLAAIAAPLLALNQLKFGHPLDFGYRHIYVNRDDDMATRCRTYGTFSAHFIPENAYYMHLAWPRVELSSLSLHVLPGPWGTSLWLTTPLMAMVFLSARQWWRDPARRALMLATLPVMLGSLCYHSPGFRQEGYNRFALDFIPVWLAVIAPHTCGGWRSWFTVVCTAWGVLWFHAVTPNQPAVVG